MSGTSSAKSRDLLLVVNAGASTVGADLGAPVASALGGAYSVEILESASPEQTEEASRAAAGRGVALVAALGGDGTARSAAAGLSGSDTALLCLPGGSRNVFARTLGLPADPLACARALAGGGLVRRRVDVGLAGGRRFLFAASIGVSARANQRLNENPQLKTRLGAAYGGAVALATAVGYIARPPRLRLSASDRELVAVSLIAQSSRPLTYVGDRPLELCEQAGLETGTLSVAALLKLRAVDLVSLPARLLLGRAGSAVAHHRVQEIPAVASALVESIDGEPFPVDLDGDHLDPVARLELGVEPGALTVLAGASSEASASGA